MCVGTFASHDASDYLLKSVVNAIDSGNNLGSDTGFSQLVSAWLQLRMTEWVSKSTHWQAMADAGLSRQLAKQPGVSVDEAKSYVEGLVVRCRAKGWIR